jgi:hypothetical protein
VLPRHTICTAAPPLEKGGADTGTGPQEREELWADTGASWGEEELAALTAVQRGERRSRRHRAWGEKGAAPAAAAMGSGGGGNGGAVVPRHEEGRQRRVARREERVGGGAGTGEGDVGIRILS